MTCAGNAYRQFDFWVGDWDVVDIERPTAVVAHAKVDRFSVSIDCLERNASCDQRSVSPISWMRIPKTESIE